ncbi:hypothetical protein FOZ62_029079 [Perkinsus olseni]|uniref:FAD-dependent oxidoreductase 2 FAD-binding domain-containing protein n=1 Tax=Perkinsus olseni TaxID=32597 RepID=A0A7J6TVG4_PEROL|nr:hypothetical protein FOZ62_029079 [Perkinsus olseni]
MEHVIVVGGGLAGLSAAHTVLERGGRVILVDKMSFCGGNSTKATSGINGALTATQRKNGIPDSPELFEKDSLRGGAERPDLIKVLTHESADGVDWLIDRFGLDLSLLSRLGGHSMQRTHRGKARFPGMTITYALMEKLEEICEQDPNRAKMILKAKVEKLLTDASGEVVGCEYVKDGKSHQLFGAVVLATGGFGADFTEGSLLKQHRPDLAHLPTTNGEHTTGDGIKMAQAIGGETVDLEWVQVHPTGLVHPDEPDNKVKFLAAEALRGVGGLLIDADGRRFCNELGRRDYVTGEMWKNKGPFRLLLNSKASKEIEWHCKHYKGRGLMKFYKSGRDLCADTGMDPKVLEDSFRVNNECAVKMAQDPEGGSYPAYPSGKSYDKWGKKFYHNTPTDINDSFHVAIVTPVIHYCMGGLKVDTDARVLKQDKPIEGLFGAGEVNGGIHGKNRLGGSSLLDCVVFGRVAGRSASRHMQERNVRVVAEKGLARSKL